MRVSAPSDDEGPNTFFLRNLTTALEQGECRNFVHLINSVDYRSQSQSSNSPIILPGEIVRFVTLKIQSSLEPNIENINFVPLMTLDATIDKIKDENIRKSLIVAVSKIVAMRAIDQKWDNLAFLLERISDNDVKAHRILSIERFVESNLTNKMLKRKIQFKINIGEIFGPSNWTGRTAIRNILRVIQNRISRFQLSFNRN